MSGWRGRMPSGYARKYPRRFVLFGPRVVPVPDLVNHSARLQHTYDVEVNRLKADLTELHQAVAKRKRQLARAHDYITDLKARLNG